MLSDGEFWEVVLRSVYFTVELVGAFSHFAWADDPGHPTVRSQVAGFAEALDVAARRGARFTVRHLANSAATLTAPDTWYDVVRPGLAVYGLSPVPQVGGPAEFGLRPAMTLFGRVATAKEVPAGHGVSYGHAYTTTSRTVLALLPLGYADGLPRHATNAGPVWLRGRRYTVAGRVCMDQIVLDVGRDAEVAAGDVAVLFGAGGDGEPTAQDWAEAAGTISEIVSRIGARPRHVGGEPSRPAVCHESGRERPAGRHGRRAGRCGGRRGDRAGRRAPRSGGPLPRAGRRGDELNAGPG